MVSFVQYDEDLTRQPPQPATVDAQKANEFKTLWFATFNSGKLVRDVVKGANLLLPGGLSASTGGVIATFDGSQYQNKVIPLPSVKPDTYVIAAKIRATAAQAGNPGAAFGIYSGTSQGGVGVGFDASHNVGLAQLTSGSASLLAYSAGAINTWYTVYAQLILDGNNVAVGKAWINGKPATTGQGSSAGSAVAALNEISIGAQHRSSGYLRAFTGNIEWAAILRYIGPENANKYSFTDSEAARLYASGYPWILFEPEIQASFVAAAGGTPHNLTVGVSDSHGNLSSTGAVSQEHQLSTAAASQINLAESGLLTQEHGLVGSAATQANTASSGSVGQAHILAEVSTIQSNASATSSVFQDHPLVGSNSTQSNESISLELGGIAITLTAAASQQGNLSSTGTIDQAFEINLVGAPSAQNSQTVVSAISQAHSLSGVTAAQQNTSAALGSLTQAQNLSGIACSQANLSSSGIIAQFISGAVLAAITFSNTVTRQITFAVRPLRSILFTQEF